jgi:hypothetical protein
VAQLEAYVHDPSAIQVEAAFNFLKTCRGEIADLNATLGSQASSLALHRKAVVGYLMEVWSLARTPPPPHSDPDPGG